MNLLQQIISDDILNKIKTEFPNEVYLVGGAVRDFILGKKNFDRDLLVCDEDAKSFSLKLADYFGATLVTLDEQNKIYRLVMPDKLNYLDITNPLENSLLTDLQRRDLTINAIAVNINTGEVVDPHQGVSDLQNKIINYIHEKNFTDDPLRLLRVFRFQANLGFSLPQELCDVVKKYKHLISKPAVERKIYEIVKLFSGEFAHLALLKMDECGLLELIFPVINELKQVPPNSHHHLDLFNHSIETVRQVTAIYNSLSEQLKEHLDTVDFGGFSRIAHLRLAGFLHDIGKFSTWSIIDGRHRFIKHDDVGSKLAHDLLKSMNFSNKQTEYISLMIKYHIYPSNVMSADDVNEKIMMRYVRRMDRNSIDNIVLAMADRLSARGPEITDEIVNKNISSLTRLLNFYLDKKETLKPLPKLLSGNEIMSILNITPSPVLGNIVNALYDAQLNGDVTCRDEAIIFIKNLKI
ncbi:MAG: HD domain-containing protein [Cyanobacteria bacterium SIG32]|nr:HD domain-containing protein [Cyanobacteria bacterium SIG32]